MSRESGIVQWIKTAFKTVGSVIVIIAYLSRRDWFITFLGGESRVTFFEGVVATVFFFYYAEKYGDAITEFVSGIRELGRQREKQKGKS